MSLFSTRSLKQIRFATIHHSADIGIPANLGQLKKRLASHNERHKKRKYPTTNGEFGYKYLLYTFAVAGNGQWLQTQDLKYKLYHATDWYKRIESANQWGFGILLEGNFEREQPTEQQLESAAQIIYKFNRENNTHLIIRGHREFAAPRYATACPGALMGLSTDPNSKLSWIIRRVSELHGDIEPEPDGTFAKATAVLNVRTGPSTKFPRIGQLKKGQEVLVSGMVTGEIVDGVNTWYKILFNEVDSFVHGKALAMMPEPDRTFATATAILNVRTGPATKFPRIGQLKKGQVVRVTEQLKGEFIDGENTWYKVPFNGIDSFVHGNWLAVVSIPKRRPL